MFHGYVAVYQRLVHNYGEVGKCSSQTGTIFGSMADSVYRRYFAHHTYVHMVAT